MVVYLSPPCDSLFQPFPNCRRLKSNVAKKEIAQNALILLNNYTFINRDFPYFYLDLNKIICCRFVECGKGLDIFSLWQ